MEFVGMLLIGSFLILLGRKNMKGDISSIHWYNRSRVAPEDAEEYGLWMGGGTCVIGGAMILYPLLQMLFPMALWDVLMLIDILGGVGVMVYGQFKYNGGLF